MNLPVQSICLPSPAASCLPVETRSILPPSMTIVAFGKTLPSAGLITVPPTSAIFSPCADSDRTERVIAARNFILLLTSMETDLSLWRLRRSHKLANGIEYHLELCIVFLLQSLNLRARSVLER